MKSSPTTIEAYVEEFQKKFSPMIVHMDLWTGYPGMTDRALTDFLHSALTSLRAETRRQFAEEVIKALDEFEKLGTGVNALPLTEDYANGWNECRHVAWDMRQKHIEILRKTLSTSNQ